MRPYTMDFISCVLTFFVTILLGSFGVIGEVFFGTQTLIDAAGALISLFAAEMPQPDPDRCWLKISICSTIRAVLQILLIKITWVFSSVIFTEKAGWFVVIVISPVVLFYIHSYTGDDLESPSVQM